MENKEKLYSFFQNELRPVLEKYEARRKDLIRKLLIWGGAGFAVTAILAAVLFAKAQLPVPFVLFILGVGVFLLFIFGGFAIKNVFRNYKYEVVKPLVKFINPNLEYYPENGISKGQFRDSRIFNDRIDRYHSEDLISGTIGKTAICFSEVHAEYKTETRNSKGGTSTSWHTILKGVFFSADFNKDFNGATVVVPDVAENLFGSFLGNALQKMNFSRSEQLVKLENPEFEKIFAVYSTDQIESRYILTPALMERLIQVRNRHGKDFYASFVNSQVNIAYGCKRNLFEPKIMSEIVDYSLIEEYFNDLQDILALVEELNLNNRIWTKK
jgi:hypothetical protein